MHNDDIPVGRVLTRREVLALMGATGATALLSACGLGGPNREERSAPDLSALESTNANLPTGCVVRPELTEGPVFVEEDLNRSDIRIDPSNDVMTAGVILDLAFNISQLSDNACVPLSGIKVDIWHCDSEGIYSDTDELGMDTVGQKFLRGYQISDENGSVQFRTIYPGWYAGRAVHIHFKMRTDEGYEFTSQLFFDDALTDEVFANAPYNTRGERSLRNDDDNIFGGSGNLMMLDLTPTADGYSATFDIALDMS